MSSRRHVSSSDLRPSFDEVKTTVDYAVMEDGSINPAMDFYMGDAGNDWIVSSTIGGVGAFFALTRNAG